MEENFSNIVTIIFVLGLQFSLGLFLLASLLKGIKILKNNKWL